MNNLFDTDRWEEIWQVLMRNKLRTFLTAFGVFWGIFMLVLMLGSGNGLQNGVTASFAGTATNSAFMWTRNTSLPYDGLPRGRFYSFRNADVEAARQQIPELEYLAARCQLGGWRGGNNVVRGAVTAAFSVYGDYPLIQKIAPVDITEGRFINEFDIQEKRKVCVIGPRAVETLFEKNETPIGEYIQISGVYFQVVGLFEPISSNNRDEALNTIYLPFTTFQQVFNWGDRIGWLTLTSKPGHTAREVQEKLGVLIKQRHRIHPDDKTAVGGWNLQDEFNKFQGLFTGIRALVWIVGIGTLLAGVIGVSNIMLIVVRERTKEIGVRRAIGAAPSSIISQIMLEALILTLVSGYLGLVAGVGLLEAIAGLLPDSPDSMFRSPGIDLNIGLAALGVLVVCGLLAGLIPARRAMSISTVDALRTEI
ncbi:MAG: ABC transporter permease [Bacteroidia bacterium]